MNTDQHRSAAALAIVPALQLLVLLRRFGVIDPTHALLTVLLSNPRDYLHHLRPLHHLSTLANYPPNTVPFLHGKPPGSIKRTQHPPVSAMFPIHPNTNRC